MFDFVDRLMSSPPYSWVESPDKLYRGGRKMLRVDSKGKVMCTVFQRAGEGVWSLWPHDYLNKEKAMQEAERRFP